MQNILALDIGGTKVAYGIFDKTGKMLNKSKFPTDAYVAGDILLEGILSKIDLANIDTVAVGIPAAINHKTGITYECPNILGLSDMDVKTYLSDKLNMDVYVENDANLAALAEHKRGAGRGQDMIYCTVSTGVGGGIIINGEIFHGSKGLAGEIGHMIITPGRGVKCSCQNRGCFESYIGGRYIKVHLADQNINTGEELLAAYDAGDEHAIRHVRQMAKKLGVMIFNMYRMTGIDFLVLGGGLTNLGDRLMHPVDLTLKELCGCAIEIKMAQLGQDSGIIGACELALMHISKERKS